MADAPLTQAMRAKIARQALDDQVLAAVYQLQCPQVKDVVTWLNRATYATVYAALSRLERKNLVTRDRRAGVIMWRAAQPRPDMLELEQCVKSKKVPRRPR